MKTLLMTLCLVLGGVALHGQSAAKGDYTGSWEYEVLTPEGDYRGIMELKMEEGKYVGHLVVGNNKTPLKNLKIEGNKMTCSVYAEGYDCDISGEFTRDAFKGGVDVEGNVMDMTAKRGGGGK